MNRKRNKKTIGPQWLRWLINLCAAACMGLAVTVAVQWVVTGSLSIVWEWFTKKPEDLILTALLYTALVYPLGALTGRLWISGAVVGGAAACLSLVDYFKTAINGTPLSLADFGLATQLGQVAGVAGSLRPPEDFWRALAALALCVGLLALTSRLTRLNGRVRFVSFGVGLATAVAMFSAVGAARLGDALGVDVYTRLSTAVNHDSYGLTLSLWRDAFLQDRAGPEGYGPDYMEGVLARIDQLLEEQGVGSGTQTVQPNVIVVLSESFYDLTRLPDLQYERDPLEHYHALEGEGISGRMHSHYLGYGTGYLEMSMLEGITGLDFGPGTNICFLPDEDYDYFDSLAEQYTNTGAYRAEMLHGYNNSLYNRTVTYPRMGFSRLLFSDDVQQLGFPWEGGVYGGYYLQDRYLFAGMLDRMKTINADGKRAFLYGITMENHQPFDPEKFGYACQIGVTSETLSDADMAIVRVMLEGITRADQALGALTDALRDSSEPTVVLFFGDHRPNLFMTDGDTVYTKLGLCPENDTVNWTAEEFDDLYSTDYLIWANDAALLSGRAGTRKDSSITALGPELLELTGQQPSRYWGLMQLVSRVCLTDTELYFTDGEGRTFLSESDAGLSAQAQELLDLRSAVLYDAFYGQGYIKEAMNQPAGT